MMDHGAIRAFVETTRPSTVPRLVWQQCCTGPERARFQRAILDAARSADGFQDDIRVSLYKAAHAILPLVGEDLITFGRLLVEDTPVSLEWADALVSLLDDKQPAALILRAKVIEALRTALTIPAQTPSDKIRQRLLRDAVQSFGSGADWLPAERPASMQEMSVVDQDALAQDPPI